MNHEIDKFFCITISIRHATRIDVSHLVRRVSVEEAGVVVNDTSELGSVQEQHKEKELLQNVL